jgi:hypothetical protein
VWCVCVCVYGSVLAEILKSQCPSTFTMKNDHKEDFSELMPYEVFRSSSPPP